MIKEPYDTTLLRNYPLKKLSEQLEVGLIEGVPTAVMDGDTPLPRVFEILPGAVGIDALVAPKLVNDRHGLAVVFDARATKRATRGGPPVIAMPADYRFQLLEAKLTLLWNTQGPSAFTQLGPLPTKVYARWIAEGIARAYGLDPLSALTLQVVAAYYYMCQLIDEAEMDEGRMFGMASVISRLFNVTPDLVAKIIGDLGHLHDGTGLVNAMRTATRNPRLESLTVGLLYTKIAGSWYGANNRTIAGVAVEYAPTFLTMLYTAFTDRGYHASYFAKTAIATDKRGEARGVEIAIDHLAREASQVHITHGVSNV